MKTINIPHSYQNREVHSLPEINVPGVFYDKFDLTNYSYIIKGVSNAKESKIVFAGCVRNVHHKVFLNNILRCHELGSKFLDYRIVIVENDSNKEFKEFLGKIKHDKVVVISNDYGYSKLGDGRDLRRITIMAKLRNLYLEYIKSNLSSFEYVCVLDFDLHKWREDGVLNTIGHDSWDMMGANGIQTKKDGSLTYYDTFAIIEQDGHTYQPQEFKGVLPLNSPKHKVIACFGGVGVYKTKSLLSGKRYGIYKINEKNCSEQCGIHINMCKAGCDKIFVNPNMLVIR